LRLTACFITFSRVKLSPEALSTAIRGGQSDDVVVVKFDLRHASAELRFGEECECADVIKADAVPPNSFGTAGVQEDSTGIDLTGNDKDCDLTGGDKEWHPISTAPLEQDLEVRLADPFGRYVLLFPCRLVPGQGWINSWLETPLPADPIDWRNWDESSLHF
jgi:hypothetical protein